MSHDPVLVGLEPRVLACKHCGEAITDLQDGLYALVYSVGNAGERHFHDVYWAHKGACDRAVKGALPGGELALAHLSGWGDLADLAIPAEYARMALATVKRIRAGEVWSEAAIDRMRDLLYILFQWVARPTTVDERARFDELSKMPGRY